MGSERDIMDHLKSKVSLSHHHQLWSGIALAGLLLISFGLVCAFLLFPFVIDQRIFRHLNPLDEDSVGWKNFVTSPFEIILRVRLFGLTNPLEIARGGRADTVEFGPYSYLLHRRKITIQVSEDDESKRIKYGQTQSFEFLPELSCEACSENDTALMLNIPLAILVNVFTESKKTTDTYSEQLIRELNDAIENISSPYSDESLFINKGVREILFAGVTPPSLQWFLDTHPALTAILPQNLIQPDRGFALFNLDQDGFEVPMFYEVSTDRPTLYQVTRFGSNSSELHPDLNKQRWWRANGGYQESNACNRLEGSADGLQFPPHVEASDRLWVVEKDLCRSNYYLFDSETSVFSLSVFRFTVPFTARDISTKDNLGFCMESEREVDWNDCAKETSTSGQILDIEDCLTDENYKGNCLDSITNVQRCVDFAPFLLSNPHFFQSKDYFWTDVGGLSEPVFERHGTFMDVEPETGIVVNFSRRYQINIPLRPVDGMSCLSEVREVLMPVIWFETSGSMDEDATKAIVKVISRPRKVFKWIQWTMVAAGAAVVVTSLVCLICGVK